MVDFLEEFEDSANIIVIRVVGWRSFLNLLHNEHIFGQSLDWLNQIVLQGEQTVRRDQACLIQEISKALSLHQLIDHGRACSVVVKVFKVHLKEMHLLLHLLKNDLIVPILVRLFEDSYKEELIEPPDLIDVYEDRLGLFFADDLFVQERSLKVRNNDAEISDIIFLCF